MRGAGLQDVYYEAWSRFGNHQRFSLKKRQAEWGLLLNDSPPALRFDSQYRWPKFLCSVVWPRDNAPKNIIVHMLLCHIQHTLNIIHHGMDPVRNKRLASPVFTRRVFAYNLPSTRDNITLRKISFNHLSLALRSIFCSTTASLMFENMPCLSTRMN